MKKVLSIILSIAMLLSITAGIDLSAYAETEGSYEYSVSNGKAEITKYRFMPSATWESLENIVIPSTLGGYPVTSIGDFAFAGNQTIETVIIPNSVERIGNQVFSGCYNLTSVEIPNSVTSIDIGAFDLCRSLTSITIPNSVTSIGNYAFQECTGLTSITIPNSVTIIGEVAFGSCTALKDVYYRGSVVEWNKISIGEGNDELTNATIHYSSSMPTNFDINKHANKFVHSDNYKTDGFFGIEDFSLSSKYLKKLEKGMTKGEKSDFVHNKVKKTWGGSCYGIAATMGLAYLGRLPCVNNRGSGYYRDMPLPYKDKEFLDNIQFYQLTQDSKQLDSEKVIYNPKLDISPLVMIIRMIAYKNDYSSVSAAFNDLIKTIDEDGAAIFSYTRFELSGWEGHAVLAVDYSINDNGNYVFKIYDENSYTDEAYKDHYRVCYGEYSKLVWNPTNDHFYYDSVDPFLESETGVEREVTNNNYVYIGVTDFDDFSNDGVSKKASSNNTYSFTVNSKSDFTVTDKDGKTFSCSDGVFDTDMNIVDFDTSVNNDKKKGQVDFTYTVEGEPDITFESESNDGHISLYNDNDFVSFESDNFDEVNINLDSGLEVSGENCEYTASVCARGDDESVYTVNATQEKDSKIVYDDEEIKLVSDNELKDVKVERLFDNGEELEEATEAQNVSANELTVTKKHIEADGEIVHCYHNFGENEHYCLNGCGTANPNYVAPQPAPQPTNSGEMNIPASINPSFSAVETIDPVTVSAPKLKKAKAGKKSFTATWAKVDRATGYEVQYSTNKKFKKPKTKAVSASKAKLTVKKLKSKKTYYVRVRAVNGAAVSPWSKTKKVKAK